MSTATVTSTLSSTSTLTEDQQLLAANTALTQGDLKVYHDSKLKLFKFTLATCVIYGSVTLFLILLTVFYPPFRTILGVDIRPFIITFCTCMIIVIIILLLIVTNFKPIANNANIYDNNICPDFWTLQQVDTKNDPIYLNAAQTSYQQYLTYQCVPNSNVWLTYNAPTSTANTTNNITTYTNVYGQSVQNVQATGNTTNPYANQISQGVPYTYSNITVDNNTSAAIKKLVGTNGTNGYLTQLTNNTSNLGGRGQSGSAIYQYGNLGPNSILCDRIFPQYLGTQNSIDADLKNVPNAFACAQAQACGIPWTNLCGN